MSTTTTLGPKAKQPRRLWVDRLLRGNVGLVTSALLLSALTTTYILWRARFVTVCRARLREPACSLLLASGAWVVVAVFLYNTILLGYGARWHGMPFLPIAVGLIAMMVGLTGAVRLAPRSDETRAQLVVVACAMLLLAAPLRMVLNQPKSEGAAEIDAIRAATFEIAERAAGRPVAFLAYDTLSRHHARFYTALSDRPPIAEFERVATANGDAVDLDQPLRAGDQPHELQNALDRALHRWAAFALVYSDTARYADPREPLWPYQVGRPVVDGLLADPAWKPVGRFTLRERELVLLENTTLRSARDGAPARLAEVGQPWSSP
jgi:hypothetical protein